MTRALIVDDVRYIRKITRGILENLGFECIEAENGAQALLKYQETRPDLIMLDWEMPVMTGIEFLENLQSIDPARGAKVVFCTSHNDIEHIKQAIAVGADEYVMKPFDQDIIAGKLRSIGLLEHD